MRQENDDDKTGSSRTEEIRNLKEWKLYKKRNL